MRNAIIGLFIINAMLVVAVAWLFADRKVQVASEGVAAGPDAIEVLSNDSLPADSLFTELPQDAKIAYFFMDSVQQGYELIAEQGARFRREGAKLEEALQKELQRSQARYEQLLNKDRTYSTQADIAKDEQEVQALVKKINELQARSERDLSKLEVEMLEEISGEIKEFLEQYNEKQQLDFIFSIQPGGQIWVGEEGLDITSDVVNGLNARHHSSKQMQVEAP